MLLSLACQLKVLPNDLNQILIITVVFSMALTPYLAELGKLVGDEVDKRFPALASADDEGDGPAMPVEVRRLVTTVVFVFVSSWWWLGRLAGWFNVIHVWLPAIRQGGD